MPFSLDFDHIVGPFRSIGASLLKPIAESFERLGKWLQDRVKQVDKLDEASRGFPIVAFYNEATTLWLDEIQRGALSPDGNPPGFLDQMRRMGEAFLGGIGRIPEAIENDLLLPRLFATARTALEAIERSMDRFNTPTPEMFDPRLRKASDLFGEAALAWRALNSSRAQVLRSLFLEIGPAYLMLRGEGGETAERRDPNSTSELLDSLSRYIVGALLVLIALPDLLFQLWESASFITKSYLLDELAKIEEDIFGLRRMLIDLVYVKFRDVIDTALAYTEAASKVVLGQLAFWAGFVQLYGRLILKELGGALNQIADYIFKVLTWIVDIFVSKKDSILTLKKWLPVAFLAGLAAGDLASKLDPLDISGIQARLDALGEIEKILAAGPEGPRKGTHTPAVLPPFPNIADSIFGGPAAAAAAARFTDIAQKLPDQLASIADAASKAMQNASFTFDRMAAAGASGGSFAEYSAIAQQAAANAEAVFGPEAKILGDRLRRDPAEQVASSLERWFAAGGFETLAQSLEGYIHEMLDTFRKQEAAGEDLTVLITKTSPAILAKKAVLGRALVQKIHINATGRRLDDALVAEIADRFRGAVVEAYRQGRQEILDVAATASL